MKKYKILNMLQAYGAAIVAGGVLSGAIVVAAANGLLSATLGWVLALLVPSSLHIVVWLSTYKELKNEEKITLKNAGLEEL